MVRSWRRKRRKPPLKRKLLPVHPQQKPGAPGALRDGAAHLCPDPGPGLQRRRWDSGSEQKPLTQRKHGAAAPVTAATDAVHLAAAWRPRTGLACLRYGEMLRELVIHIALSTPE